MNSTISIIINNYNYGKFLDETVRSILNQTHKPHEIIVVDDGSTDNSLSILEKYGAFVTIVKKKNGGQASAFNEGFRIATGEWIWFVDSDDYLDPTALETLIPYLNDEFVKVQFPLQLVDEIGQKYEGLNPVNVLSSGIVIDEVIANGDYSWPPTTGNIFSKKLLEACMPIPEDKYRLSADFYLCSFAGMQGAILSLDFPLAFYRVHQANGHFGFTLNQSRLYKRGEILLNTVNRMQELIRTSTPLQNYEYPFSRAILESLVISKRFGALNLPPDLKGLSLHKKWFSSRQFKATHGKARLVAIIFWAGLNYAPLFISRSLIMKGIKKGMQQNSRTSATEAPGA